MWKRILEPQVWLECEACGWRAGPFSLKTLFLGLGGQIPCPECTKKLRNKNIETYGRVRIVKK